MSLPGNIALSERLATSTVAGTADGSIDAPCVRGSMGAAVFSAPSTTTPGMDVGAVGMRMLGSGPPLESDLEDNPAYCVNVRPAIPCEWVCPVFAGAADGAGAAAANPFSRMYRASLGPFIMFLVRVDLAMAEHALGINAEFLGNCSGQAAAGRALLRGDIAIIARHKRDADRIAVGQSFPIGRAHVQRTLFRRHKLDNGTVLLDQIVVAKAALLERADRPFRRAAGRVMEDDALGLDAAHRAQTCVRAIRKRPGWRGVALRTNRSLRRRLINLVLDPT